MTNTPLGLPYPEYHVDGIEDTLCQRVCEALYLKRQGLDEVEVDMSRMMVHFNSDEQTLTTIIRWYESNLLSTKFIIK